MSNYILELFICLVTFILFAIKLAGATISWWYVWLPIIIYGGILAIILLLVLGIIVFGIILAVILDGK